MTELLEKAFAEASNMPQEAQDEFARWMLAELESERRWDHAFSDSADKLRDLAAEALEEYRSGNTEELDPDTL